MLKASSFRFYNDLHCWLIITTDLPKLVKLVSKASFSLATDFAVATLLESRNIYNIHDVFTQSRDRGTDLNVFEFGSWSKQKGLLTNHTKNKIVGRFDMRGLSLRSMYLVSLLKYLYSICLYKTAFQRNIYSIHINNEC